MKLTEICQRPIFSRVVFSSLLLILIASSVNYAGALTAATADKKNPTGNTYSGKGSDSDKEKSKTEAKKKSRSSAEKACKDYCDPKQVCSQEISEPGEMSDDHCPNVSNDPKRPKYECTLSSSGDATNHGCKLTKCVCCSFSEGDPIFVDQQISETRDMSEI